MRFPQFSIVLNFLTAFSKDVWVYLAGAYVFVSMCFFFLGRISPSQWENPYPCVEDAEHLENQFTFQNSMWFAIGALLQQVNHPPWGSQRPNKIYEYISRDRKSNQKQRQYVWPALFGGSSHWSWSHHTPPIWQLVWPSKSRILLSKASKHCANVPNPRTDAPLNLEPSHGAAHWHSSKYALCTHLLRITRWWLPHFLDLPESRAGNVWIYDTTRASADKW